MPLGHPFPVQFDWDSKKNEFLKATRNISFEAIIVHLERGDVWKIATHPNQAKYPGQKMLFVKINEYIFIVPFETRGDVIWFITIIPSRKATRLYLEEKNHETE